MYDLIYICETQIRAHENEVGPGCSPVSQLSTALIDIDDNDIIDLYMSILIVTIHEIYLK